LFLTTTTQINLSQKNSLFDLTSQWLPIKNKKKKKHNTRSYSQKEVDDCDHFKKENHPDNTDNKAFHCKLRHFIRNFESILIHVESNFHASLVPNTLFRNTNEQAFPYLKSLGYTFKNPSAKTEKLEEE